jgi:tetratricopeptide (TPR) repeat protein
MQMPTVYNDDILAVESHYPDCSPHRPAVYSMVYPPVGFFPFAGTGNGDYHGFYWPIGREDASPIVAYSSHDAYALIPEHGDLGSAGRCQLARSKEQKLSYEFRCAFASAREPLPKIDIADAIAVDDHRQLLTLDPNSPFRNCAVADQDIIDGNLDTAEAHYRRAIELLPEYGAAHFGLGYLLRRLRRQEEASIHLRKSLMCPLAFWGGCFWADHILPGDFRKDWARKALLSLQATKGRHESLLNDPFLHRIGKMTLATGVAENPDFDILQALIDDYLDRKLFLDAIYLWINIGDRAALETTSFRERYGLTSAFYAIRLSELLRRAGNELRASLVDSMIAMMRKPSGLHL